MKRINYKLLLPGSLALIALLFACGKNFLNKPPQGVLSPQILGNYAGVQGLLIGAYSDLTGEGTSQGGSWGSAADNWVYASVVADDAYKGSVAGDQPDIIQYQQWDALATGAYIANKFAAMYDGVQRANDVIRNMRVATGLTPADTVEFKAEALFLRAFFHFELRKMFFYPPFVDETITVSANNYNVPNYNSSGYIEIYPFIEADFTYAMANLPVMQPYKGQANKYAAEAFLAKVYMYEGKYAAAQPLLDDLIANGETAQGVKYALQPNYSQNFNPNPAAKNSSESIFAVQISVNDGSGTYGGKAYGDNLNFPYGGGPGACCGFDNPTQDLADAMKTDVTGLPLPLTGPGAFNSAPHVSDQSATPWVGTVDPRIDWTLGRVGVAYLDWGPHPGDTWIRSPGDDGHFSPKKNVYAKAVQGTYSDGSSNWANVELAAVNVNLIRYAQVLLWDAECNVINSKNLAQAEAYVNMVRNRVANNPSTWVYNSGTFNAGTYTYSSTATPAGNYAISPYSGQFSADPTGVFAMQAIIMENRLELAEEGQRFFDLARWQLNGNPIFPTPGSNFMGTTLTTYATIENQWHPAQFPANLTFTNGKCEYYPIPQQQIDAENSTGKINLKQIPGY